MKKIVASLLLLIICVGFVGCGKKEESKEETKNSKSNVEYKDYDENGKINYLDKGYALSQASGLNIEYTTTTATATTNNKLTIKGNMISSLNETDNSGEFFEFVDNGNGVVGNYYKRENGVWRRASDIGFKSSKDEVDILKRKDIYIYVERVAKNMGIGMDMDKYKDGEVTYLGRKCTKYVQTVPATSYSEEYQKIMYADNETEMPLYYKDNKKTVEVTKYETSVNNLSVPQV